MPLEQLYVTETVVTGLMSEGKYDVLMLFGQGGPGHYLEAQKTYLTLFISLILSSKDDFQIF